MWYTVDKFYASIECIFLNKRKVGVWPTKMMHISCTNIEYRRICLTIFLITGNEASSLKYVLACRK